jgi:hypothetical protein
MSKFKIKKIHPPEKSNLEKASPDSHNTKKILKYIVGTMIAIVTILFGASLAIQSMGSIALSNTTIQFTPIVFGTGTGDQKETGTTNILIA